MDKTVEFLLPSDAANLLDLTPAGVKLAARTGRLQVAAKTRRGVHLFRLEDIEAFKRRREALASSDEGTGAKS